MPAMTELTIYPSAIVDIHARTSFENGESRVSTPSSDPQRRSVDPSNLNELSPLDALAAQGRLLNKRLTQHGRIQSFNSNTTRASSGLDDPVFPKFGLGETFDDRLLLYERRNRLPEKRRTGGTDSSDSPRSPLDSLSLATLSLLNMPRPMSPKDKEDVPRSGSQSSSFLSTSTDESTPTEHYLVSQLYKPPPKIDPPKMRPATKNQESPISHSHGNPPPSPKDQNNPSDQPVPPSLQKSLDRPRLPSIQATRDYHSRRTPSINFSRPYSSRSSAYSEASSMYEIDEFPPKSMQSEPQSSTTERSPNDFVNSPILNDEELKKLPQGRRKSKPITDDGVFFHSTSVSRLDAAHRWPVTPIYDEMAKFKEPVPPLPKNIPSPSRVNPSTSKTSSPKAPSRSATEPLPATRTPGIEASRPPLASPRSLYSLRPPLQRIFSFPTQILDTQRPVSTSNSSRSTSLTADDHVTLGIKFHQQDLLPQSTQHFQLAAQMGSAAGMLFYSLSLRHGWGCSSNQEKAVEWLHNAAEAASAKVDEQGIKRHATATAPIIYNSEDGKRGGATLALAIYELGQSYLHGWGVQKDKHLALRCFEISAHFGDRDGQSETAWCYLNGVGCKKNVKLAARYYRMAERQGVKEPGLSWIWKNKYDEKGGRKERRRPAATDEVSKNERGEKGKEKFVRKNTA